MDNEEAQHCQRGRAPRDNPIFPCPHRPTFYSPLSRKLGGEDVVFFQEAFLIQRRLEAQINALNQEAAQLRQQHTNSQARIRSLEERNSQLKVRGGPTPDPTPKTLSVGNPARPQRCTRGCENTQPRVSRLGPLLN